MRNSFLVLLLVLLSFSCASKKDDPLVLPPNFAEMPDLNNIEKPNATNSEENIAKLKELLIKSD